MIDKSKVYYLSGPMSGIPQFNFPEFEHSARRLRSLGVIIVSPHEQDSEETRQMAWSSADGAHTGVGESWGTCLARDVKLIADECQGIILLPKWYLSRGARLEAFTGLLTGAVFYRYDFRGSLDTELLPASHEMVQQAIRENMP